MSAAKKTLVFTLTVLVLLIVLTPIVYARVGTKVYAHRVKVYLTEEMGYTRAEITSVKGKWTIKAPPFVVHVKFRDEPEVEYTYFAHAGVIQFSHEISRKGLDQGVTEKNLKHYVSLD
ncbi:DUF3139 domain-containing protein [Paenibacillus sp. P46E]|uniref:DUF3139 domain-containing protein n=1 Tax=Paenibacillus sp. P46E TaxID=1349436 RepID=UPI00093C54F3|nr:DUF3139 domain-containing protein [Paenibacillus sp. P46E]OKP99119.1 hypothetical protein A3849_06685 [Paenibacillus sp. P46E]